jgi:uncharacterized protein (TIGR03067 family)
MGQDLDKLQGNWNIVSLEMDGQKMIADGGGRIEVRGDRFRSVGMRDIYEGTVAVHEATKPKSFELHFEEGPEKGNVNFGIYELDGDTWKICLATRGSERPKEFAAPPGTGIALETLHRQAAADAQRAPDVPAASGAPAGEPAPELAGEWTSVSLVRDGEALPKSMLKYGKRTATADEVEIKFGPTVMLKARYAVDRSRTPMTMDYLLANGTPQYGIWTLDGKQLTTCFGSPGKPRPNEFSSTPGDGRTLAGWTPAGK